MKTTKYIYSSLLVVFMLLFTACEKVIDITLDEGTVQLSVDAFINDKPGKQIVKLTKTISYFNNGAYPAATGATVKITDDKGKVFNFIDVNNNGNYEWNSATNNDSLVFLARKYTLDISYEGVNYQATSWGWPTVPVDSITIQDDKNPLTGEFKKVANLWARDIAGLPNFYWIRTYVNGKFLGGPTQNRFSQDGGFAGSGTDGLVFIFPIRRIINPSFNDPGYNVGDSINVEIHSLNPETFYFLRQVRQESQNGGLFASPPYNVSTNIKNITSGSTSKAVGFFNISMVRSGSKKVK